MTKDAEVEDGRVLDDGVNDAWYKSECGQACGFGGEKFKWLVRMVLLHPCSRCFTFPPSPPLSLSISISTSISLFPTLSLSVLVNPESEKLGFGYFLHFRHVRITRIKISNRCMCAC